MKVEHYYKPDSKTLREEPQVLTRWIDPTIEQLQQENKQLKEEKDTLYNALITTRTKYNNDKARYRRKAKRYKQKIDKAIEFLHNENVIVWHVSKKDLPDEWEHIEPLELLEILGEKE